VHYPFADLLGILALESRRNRCLVIGEDLGTVPEDLRAALAPAGVLSYRLLLFERLPSDEFKPPAEYPAQAIVAVSTHDLPTLAGWWEGRDLALRAELGLFPDEAVRVQQIAARTQDRARLLRALDREQLLPPGVDTDPESLPTMTSAFAHAVHAFLAQTPAQLLVAQLEDVIGVREQANMPATVDTHPNWRRKLPLALERWPDDPRFVDLASTLRQRRPAAERRHRQALRDPTKRAERRTACNCTAISILRGRPNWCRISPRWA
jgi:(1->4)-alpha-D-glucan 1-alpha-D-glucosylmutase